jgi:hypothetical protein
MSVPIDVVAASIAGAQQAENAGVASTGAAENLLEEVTVGAQRPKSRLNLFDGPLKALESGYNEFENVLTYPQDLGTNSQFKYVMRMLIFQQVREVNPLPIITPNSLDRSYRAAQEGRLNTDVVTFGTGIGVGAAAAAGIGTNVINAFSSKLPVLNKLAGSAENLVTSGLQLGGAAATATNIDSNFGLNQITATEPLSYINLYMPDGLNYIDRHDYDSVSVTDALGGLGLLATGNVTEIAARLGEQARVAGVSLLGQNITDLALYNSGYALNPQLQVLFKGSKNREFVFTFKFIPRNAYEALTIESIIRTLRYHAAPNYEAPGEDGNINARYFIPPSQFEIEFLVMDQSAAFPNDKLPRIAKSVLSNIDVNYAPSGQFAAYQDYQPVETQLQLTFTETVILTKKDVEIGY